MCRGVGGRERVMKGRRERERERQTGFVHVEVWNGYYMLSFLGVLIWFSLFLVYYSFTFFPNDCN